MAMGRVCAKSGIRPDPPGPASPGLKLETRSGPEYRLNTLFYFNYCILITKYILYIGSCLELHIKKKDKKELDETQKRLNSITLYLIQHIV